MGLSRALVSIAAISLFAGCGAKSQNEAKSPAPMRPSPPRPVVVACTRAAGGPEVARIGDVRSSSSVALGSLGGKTVAWVADEDERAVHAVDVDAGKVLASLPLEGKPSQVMVLADGRLLVALRDAGKIQVLDPVDASGKLEARCAIDVPAEPVALATTPDDATILVSSGWARKLSAFDAKSLAKKGETPLPREPRAIAVSDDGRRAFVAHAVGGQTSVVDLGSMTAGQRIALHGDDGTGIAKASARKTNLFGPSRTTTASCQGFALAKMGERILAPQVLVEPGDRNARPSGYGSDIDQTEVASVAVIDARDGSVLDASIEKIGDGMLRSMRGESREHHHEECLLPRASAVDPASHTLLVTCLGIDAVVAYDALAAAPARAETRRWTVAAGPIGVAIDGAKHRAIVWSQFDRTLDRISLGGSELAVPAKDDVVRIALPHLPGRELAMGAALGRLLFHAVGDARVSHDGRACASCHPDGRDDGLTWSTPDGPRRSIMLAGRVAATAPYSWSGSESTLKEHLDITFERLHGAGGLKSLELDALADYVATLAPPARAPLPPDPVVERGAAIFASQQAGCSGCHVGADGTDNQKHDVGSRGPLDRAAEFNTPTLRFVGGIGPYFHDGRYATLHDLLVGVDGKMGHTSQLSPDDLAALEAYVRSL